eukprot:163492-Ditylum_brightwellii.AAC.1
MDKHLLDHHKRHFHQAYRTLFTLHPICSFIVEKGPKGFLQGLKDKSIKIEELNITDFTKDMLKRLTPSHTVPTQLEYNLKTTHVQQGYKIWSENTATSLTGRYLS